MNLKDKYFNLCYIERIHEYSKIDKYKNSPDGASREKYDKIDVFYERELNINSDKLKDLRESFKEYNNLYRLYYNKNRHEMFKDYNGFMKWYKKQKDSCQYCEITKEELLEVVKKRGEKLTLNGKPKRSKGTLEIEKKNPSDGYTFSNCILACPLCNNAKSNLISAADWKKFFVPTMKKFYQNELSK